MRARAVVCVCVCVCVCISFYLLFGNVTCRLRSIPMYMDIIYNRLCRTVDEHCIRRVFYGTYRCQMLLEFIFPILFFHRKILARRNGSIFFSANLHPYEYGVYIVER